MSKAKKKTTAKKPAPKKSKPKTGKSAAKKSASKPSRPAARKTVKKPPATKKSPAKKSVKAAHKKSKRAAAPAKTVPAKPMDPALRQIKEKLLTNRRDLLRMIGASQEMERNLGDVTFSNEIDLASSLEGREMVFQLASRDRNELKLLDDALIKIDKGSYGVCEGCAKQIGMKRLQIMPLTAFCIDCQSGMEVAE